MTWRGPVLADEQRDVMAMLSEFAADQDVVLSDEPRVVRALIDALVDLGVWTLGVAADRGGPGASQRTTSAALVQIGRHWPALGLASVQAHAAAGLLAGDERCTDLLARVHAGTATVAVADAGSAHVRLSRTAGTLRGHVDRVDAAAEAPYLLMLTGPDTALLAHPAACTPVPLRRTGLAGALTRSLEIRASGDTLTVLTGLDVPAARARLRLGIAAVAAGIAAAAADSAAGYASGRRQFGAALTAIPTVRQSLLAQAARTSVILDTVLAAEGEDPVRSLATAREACDGAIDVAAAALQSHGGYGYLTEYPAERYLRDAVSLRAAADLHGAAVATARTLAGLAPAEAFPREAS